MRGLDSWICGDREPNTISDDQISPHYGHKVADLDADGRWHCETCDGPLEPIDGDCYDDVKAEEMERRLVDEADEMFELLSIAVSQSLFEKYDQRERARACIERIVR